MSALLPTRIGPSGPVDAASATSKGISCSRCQLGRSSALRRTAAAMLTHGSKWGYRRIRSEHELGAGVTQ
jgi:hypothetical protein